MKAKGWRYVSNNNNNKLKIYKTVEDKQYGVYIVREKEKGF